MRDPNYDSAERHVLVINDGKRRAIALDSAAYSIGRDESNAIVLDSPTVSRKHAILLRLPTPGQRTYRYRLVDGDSEGNRSANGIYINDKRCSSQELADGDRIGLGRKIKASYLIVSMGEAEFIRYLESTDFQRLRSDAVNPKATLVASDLEQVASPAVPNGRGRDPATLLAQNEIRPNVSDTLPEATAQATSRSTIKEERPKQTLIIRKQPRLGMLVGFSCLVILLGMGGWYISSQKQRQPAASPSTQTQAP